MSEYTVLLLTRVLVISSVSSLMLRRFEKKQVAVSIQHLIHLVLLNSWPGIHFKNVREY